jgi:signal recognition particle subunit SRP54
MDDKLLVRQRAIIMSMTTWERQNPKLIKASRKKRIAAGSGVDVAQVNKLLKMHRQMSDMMKKMGKGGMAGMAAQMAGMPGMPKGMMKGMGGKGGGMPDLAGMDPAELEALKKQMGSGLPGLGKLPGLGGAKLPGLGGGLPGLGGGPKFKK